jgi:hypothetical protein
VAGLDTHAAAGTPALPTARGRGHRAAHRLFPGAKECSTKIRDLKRKFGEAVVRVWPSSWGGSYKAGDKFAAGDEGVLVSVTRIGNRLTLTMKYDGRDHMGSLEWDAPPTLDAVEKVLKANVGKPIKTINDLDVELLAPPPPGRNSRVRAP